MTIKLTLDGERLPGSELTVSINFSIPSDDLSGQGSSTVDAETGDKPQLVRVRLLIPHKTPDDLKIIRDLAGKRAEDGSRHIYTIVNDSAQAMSIRQVKFHSEMLVKEDQKKAWWVNFVLKEHRSVAEKVEEQKDLSAKEQTAVETPTPAPVVENSEEKRIEKLVGIERWLSQGESWFE